MLQQILCLHDKRRDFLFINKQILLNTVYATFSDILDSGKRATQGTKLGFNQNAKPRLSPFFPRLKLVFEKTKTWDYSNPGLTDTNTQ